VEPVTEAQRKRQTPGLWPLKKHDKGEYIFKVPGHALNLPPAPPLDETNNPYRGLEPFEEENSHLFFGRKALTETLHEFVLNHQLTVVLGSSGIGKSSIVRAGLIPYLKKITTEEQHNQEEWNILPPIRPGESPLNAVNRELAEARLPVVNLSKDTPLAERQTLVNSITAWSRRYPSANLLMAIDQCEEIVTLCQDDMERRRFLDAVAEVLAAQRERFHLVFILRSDFEPLLRDTALEPYWPDARFIVPPMTREELREAIEEPAFAAVLYFEPHSLVDRLIDEVAQMPGALPLLSFTLRELYLIYLQKQRRGEREV
jgi:hypothetical protein